MIELFSLRWRHLTRAERVCLAALLATLIVWMLLPAIPQDQAYHAFADQRAWLDIPHAADVLSNLAFVAVGLLGVVRLASPDRAKYSSATEAGLWCFALGSLCTGVGSAWYHLNPIDATLVWDRLPMTLAFTGVLGAAIAQRVGNHIASVGFAVLLVVGISSIAYWQMTGDLSPYLVFQYGGIAALLTLLILTRKGNDPFPWWWLIAWYILAKVFEAGDQAVWEATKQILAGHTLKHLAAAVGCAAMLAPLRARTSSLRG